MFKQFTSDISGHQVYLLTSLAIFLIFFIVVTLLLVKMRKRHIDHMSDLPLQDAQIDNANNLLP